MTRYATISHLAQIELDQLADLGITPTPAEIVEMSALGWEVETSDTTQYLARGVPVRVGGAVLWPLTLAAGDWYDRKGTRYRDTHGALAYAMAHGHTEAIATATEKDVRQWVRKLTCTRGQLDVAISEVLAQDTEADMPPEKQDAKHSAIPLTATLLAAVGGTPEMWERQMSIGYIRRVMDAVVMQNTEQGKSSASDPRLRAQVALYYAAEKVRKRAQAEASNG